MVTAAAIASVYLLLRARREQSLVKWLAAGALLGVIVLIRITMLPFAAGAVAWIALFGEGPSRQKLLRGAVVFLIFSIVVGAWVERNYIHYGRIMLTSTTGLHFWRAHNSQTFNRYPAESIDLSRNEALKALTPSEKSEFEALRGDELRLNDWFLRKGLDYVRDHPGETLIGAARKVAAGFSWTLNPSREPLMQVIYFISYAPMLILAIVGMILARHGWREQSLIYLQFLVFIAVSAVFWAHTSHRVHLDVYLIVFSAFSIYRLVVFVGRSSSWWTLRKALS